MRIAAGLGSTAHHWLSFKSLYQNIIKPVTIKFSTKKITIPHYFAYSLSMQIIHEISGYNRRANMASLSSIKDCR
jgi:hypothetical protein